jgi:hypothetical protein
MKSISQLTRSFHQNYYQNFSNRYLYVKGFALGQSDTFFLISISDVSGFSIGETFDITDITQSTIYGTASIRRIETGTNELLIKYFSLLGDSSNLLNAYINGFQITSVDDDYTLSNTQYQGSNVYIRNGRLLLWDDVNNATYKDEYYVSEDIEGMVINHTKSLNKYSYQTPQNNVSIKLNIPHQLENSLGDPFLFDFDELYVYFGLYDLLGTEDDIDFGYYVNITDVAGQTVISYNPDSLVKYSFQINLNLANIYNRIELKQNSNILLTNQKGNLKDVLEIKADKDIFDFDKRYILGNNVATAILKKRNVYSYEFKIVSFRDTYNANDLSNITTIKDEYTLEETNISEVIRLETELDIYQITLDTYSNLEKKFYTLTDSSDNILGNANVLRIHNSYAVIKVSEETPEIDLSLMIGGKLTDGINTFNIQSVNERDFMYLIFNDAVNYDIDTYIDITNGETEQTIKIVDKVKADSLDGYIIEGDRYYFNKINEAKRINATISNSSENGDFIDITINNLQDIQSQAIEIESCVLDVYIDDFNVLNEDIVLTKVNSTTYNIVGSLPNLGKLYPIGSQISLYLNKWINKADGNIIKVANQNILYLPVETQKNNDDDLKDKIIHQDIINGLKTVPIEIEDNHYSFWIQDATNLVVGNTYDLVNADNEYVLSVSDTSNINLGETYNLTNNPYSYILSITATTNLSASTSYNITDELNKIDYGSVFVESVDTINNLTGNITINENPTVSDLVDYYVEGQIITADALGTITITDTSGFNQNSSYAITNLAQTITYGYIYVVSVDNATQLTITYGITKASANNLADYYIFDGVINQDISNSVYNLIIYGTLSISEILVNNITGIINFTTGQEADLDTYYISDQLINSYLLIDENYGTVNIKKVVLDDFVINQPANSFIEGNTYSLVNDTDTIEYGFFTVVEKVDGFNIKGNTTFTTGNFDNLDTYYLNLSDSVIQIVGSTELQQDVFQLTLEDTTIDYDQEDIVKAEITFTTGNFDNLDTYYLYDTVQKNKIIKKLFYFENNDVYYITNLDKSITYGTAIIKSTVDYRNYYIDFVKDQGKVQDIQDNYMDETQLNLLIDIPSDQDLEDYKTRFFKLFSEKYKIELQKFVIDNLNYSKFVYDMIWRTLPELENTTKDLQRVLNSQPKKIHGEFRIDEIEEQNPVVLQDIEIDSKDYLDVPLYDILLNTSSHGFVVGDVYDITDGGTVYGSAYISKVDSTDKVKIRYSPKTGTVADISGKQIGGIDILGFGTISVPAIKQFNVIANNVPETNGDVLIDAGENSEELFIFDLSTMNAIEFNLTDNDLLNNKTLLAHVEYEFNFSSFNVDSNFEPHIFYVLDASDNIINKYQKTESSSIRLIHREGYKYGYSRINGVNVNYNKITIRKIQKYRII